MENTIVPHYTMTFGDYLDILRRRKMPFYMAFILILGISLIIAFSLPPVYRSEATILIEKQEIPHDLVATTVTGYVQERIIGIKQSLVTYERLVEIANKLDLFPEMREAGDISNMVSKIRESIFLQMVDVKASDSRKPGQATATVSFTVAYEADSPEVAQKVTAELANRYLEGNKQARSKQTAEVSEFLDKEADRLRGEIVELEKSLANFKQEQREKLPELMQVNMRLYEKTEGQIEQTKDKISKLEDTKISLESVLSLTDPRKAVLTDEGKVIQSPTDRLSVLIADFLQSSARYTPSHPDIVRLRREVQILGGQSDKGARVNELVSNITRERNKLIEVKQKYSIDHPDVLKLEKSIAKQESALRNMEVSVADNAHNSNVPADNPRYVQLKTQLDATISNLRDQRSKLRQYNEKLNEYEKRLFQTPVVERDYKSLSRDYANAKQKYEELRGKQLEARLAEKLEAGEKGERFVLEGAAYYPTSPDKPNRLGIILLGGLLAFSGGLGSVAMAEYKDKSVRGKRGIVQIFGALPIATIPYIENTFDVSTRLNRRRLKIVVFLIVISIILASIHFYVMPLNEIFSEQQT